MSQDTSMGVRRGELANPLHIQHLEKALDVEPFLSYVEQIFNTPLTSDESSSDSDADVQLTEAELARGSRILNGVKTNREERRLDKMRLYNLDGVKHDRYWLRELLLSDTSCSSEEEEEEEEEEDRPVSEESIRQMLRQHVLCKKYAEQFHTNPENMQYQYYSVGLLSNYDKFPEHQRSIVGNRKKKKTKKMEKKLKKIKKLSARERRLLEEAQEQETDDLDYEDMLMDVKVEDDVDGYMDASCGYPRGSRSRKRAQQARNPEVMAIRRRKIWMMMSKKELGKTGSMTGRD